MCRMTQTTHMARCLLHGLVLMCVLCLLRLVVQQYSPVRLQKPEHAGCSIRLKGLSPWLRQSAASTLHWPYSCVTGETGRTHSSLNRCNAIMHQALMFASLLALTTVLIINNSACLGIAATVANHWLQLHRSSWRCRIRTEMPSCTPILPSSRSASAHIRRSVLVPRRTTIRWGARKDICSHTMTAIVPNCTSRHLRYMCMTS